MKTNNYFQFNLETNNRTISVPVKNLSKKQEMILSKLDQNDAFSYLMSFLPKHKKINTVKTLGYTKSSQKLDLLANRHKNHYLNVLRNQCRADNAKVPVSNAFHFGIEIECYMSYKSVDVYYSSGSSECSDCEGSGRLTYTHRDSGAETESECQTCCGTGENENDDNDSNSSEDEAIGEVAKLIKNAGIKGCHVKSDGSIETPDNSDYFGVEIAVLTTDFKNLEKLCALLKSLGAQINASCGLHVHLDARKMVDDKNQLSATSLANLNNSQLVLFRMLPKSRSTSSFCKKGYSYSNRYSAINLTSLSKFNTVEIRMHSGTIDFTKIVNWAMILRSIFFHDVKSETEFTSVTELCKFFGLDKDLKKYMLSRQNKFTGDIDVTNDSESEMAA